MTEEAKKPEQAEVKADRTSQMMDDMIKGLREFGATALEKAEEFGKIATEKAEELTKLGKIKLDIHQLNRSRAKALAELGELVFNLGEEGKLAKLAKHENYIVLAKSIKEIAEEIKEKDAQADHVATVEGEAEVQE
ncbi:MAG: hypothetical protein L3J79_04915 [Candidatus Marinimicrobia bacterium]|nr:hypothetical protein [Candidatus Neomarinimicrobiota bacterium]